MPGAEAANVASGNTNLVESTGNIGFLEGTSMHIAAGIHSSKVMFNHFWAGVEASDRGFRLLGSCRGRR